MELAKKAGPTEKFCYFLRVICIWVSFPMIQLFQFDPYALGIQNRDSNSNGIEKKLESFNVFIFIPYKHHSCLFLDLAFLKELTLDVFGTQFLGGMCWEQELAHYMHSK